MELDKLEALAKKCLEPKGWYQSYDFSDIDVEVSNDDALLIERCTPTTILQMIAKIKAADELADKIDNVDIYHDPRCSKFKYADSTCECGYIEFIKYYEAYRKAGESDE